VGCLWCRGRGCWRKCERSVVCTAEWCVDLAQVLLFHCVAMRTLWPQGEKRSYDFTPYSLSQEHSSWNAFHVFILNRPIRYCTFVSGPTNIGTESICMSTFLKSSARKLSQVFRKTWKKKKRYREGIRATWSTLTTNTLVCVSLRNFFAEPLCSLMSSHSTMGKSLDDVRGLQPAKHIRSRCCRWSRTTQQVVEVAQDPNLFTPRRKFRIQKRVKFLPSGVCTHCPRDASWQILIS